MEDRLKSCPFCGGKAIVRRVYEDRFGECCDCSASSASAKTKELAIKAWNTRKPMDRIVEQLENASCYIEDGDGHAGHVIFTDKAIEIVKAGGKGE